MRLTSWDLVASFLIGAAAASVAWGVWTLVHRRAADPAPASRAGPPAPDDPPPAAAPRPSTPGRTNGAGGVLRTSQRVIQHLARQPRLGYGDVAPRAVTQAGMTDALGVPQPALTKVLGRLVDGGALIVTRTHVAGAPRRLKVYQLTAHGEAIARDLRRRGPPAPPVDPGVGTPTEGPIPVPPPARNARAPSPGTGGRPETPSTAET